MSAHAESKLSIRQLPAWTALAFALATLLALVASSVGWNPHADLQDFVEYWGAGRLNSQGQNPYDPALLYQMERAVSPGLTEAIMMWNPPWTLALAMPFSWLPAQTSHALWIAIQLTALLASVDWLWRSYGGPRRYSWVAWLLSVGFLPTFFALRMGQISPLILLALVGFLYFERRGQGALAGAALALATIKPHLVLVFGAAVLLWAIHRRRWSVLLGGATALLALVGVALAFNPNVLHQYADAMRHRPPQFLSPTLGSILRLVFGFDNFRLQFLPAALGLGWVLSHWWSRRDSWRWINQTPLLLLVSFLTASYGAWQFDLVVLLIPLLQGAVWVLRDRTRGTVLFATVAYFGFDLTAYLMKDIRYTHYYWCAWMTPMLFYCYLVLRSRLPRRRFAGTANTLHGEGVGVGQRPGQPHAPNPLHAEGVGAPSPGQRPRSRHPSITLHAEGVGALSPGQRPGSQHPLNDPQPEGLGQTRADRTSILTALQAERTISAHHTQGVALGLDLSVLRTEDATAAHDTRGVAPVPLSLDLSALRTENTTTLPNRTPFRRTLLWAGFAIVAVLLALQGGRLANVTALGTGDFIAYWSAGRLNAQGQNPYSPEALLPLERAEGWPEDWPNIMYYPPWALVLVMPFGVASFNAARLAWLLAEIAILVFSVDRIWRYYGGPSSHRWLAWGLGMAFVPTLIALRMGQVGPFLLLGVVGFLLCQGRRMDVLAGACLALCAVKPQLLYLFGLAVVVWAIDRRRWRVLAGGASALLAALAIAFWRNPDVLQQYRFALFHPPSGNITPTLGALLRLAFGHELVWLQFVPTILGLVWFPFYYVRRRARWDWAEQTPLLLLASFLTTSYGAWVFDLVVLLIPTLCAAVWVVSAGRGRLTAWAVASFLVGDGIALLLNLGGAAYLSFIWMTPAILVGFLLLKSQTNAATEDSEFTEKRIGCFSSLSVPSVISVASPEADSRRSSLLTEAEK
jgi:Glycosyltransferase family 87